MEGALIVLKMSLLKRIKKNQPLETTFNLATSISPTRKKHHKNLPTQKYEFIFTFVFLPPPLIKQLTLPAALKPSKQHRTHL